MTNVEAVTPVKTEGNGKAKRDVRREFKVYDELPPRAAREPSELEQAFLQAKEAPQGKWVEIGSYATAPAATGAANILKSRHGRNVGVEGVVFRTMKNLEGRSLLLVKFDTSKIVQGEKQKHDKAEAEKKAKAAAKQAAKV